MKQRSLATILAVFVFTILCIPSVALAANASFLGPIVPACGGPGQPECNVCHLVSLIQNVLNFLVGFGVLAATGLFAYAGILMITAVDDTGKITTAKKIFLDVVVGLVIMLVAWLAIDTIMKAFVVDKSSGQAGFVGSLGPWNEVLCPYGFVPANRVVPEGSTTGTVTTSTTTTSTGGGNGAAILEQLRNAGVVVSSSSGVVGDCNASNCTSLNGMRASTVTQIINIKNACRSLTVTGGTEPGHSSGTYSHANGYKVDVSTAADSCLQTAGRLTRTGRRGGDYGGDIYVDSCGNEYVRESNHWDITVFRTCNL